MNGCAASQASIRPGAVEQTLNQLDRRRGGAARRARSPSALEAYRFNEAATPPTRSSGTSSATGISSWPSRSCTGADDAAKAETRATAAWVLDRIAQAAASVHAVHHRGTVGDQRALGPGRAARCWRSSSWPQHEGLENAGGRGRDRLGGRAHLRGPLGALGDERAGQRAMPLVIVGADARPAHERQPLDRHDQAPGAHLRHRASRSSRRRERADDRARRRVALPLAGVIDIAAEKSRLGEGDRQGGEGSRQGRRQARQRGLRRPRPEEVVEENRERRQEALRPHRSA